MKKVTKLAMLLLAGTLSTGFVSCSSSDDVTPSPLVTEEQQTELNQAEKASSENARKTEMGKVIANYLEMVVRPTYADLAGKADIITRPARTFIKNVRLANLHKAI